MTPRYAGVDLIAGWAKKLGWDFNSQPILLSTGTRGDVVYSRALRYVRRSGVHEIVREILAERGAL